MRLTNEERRLIKKAFLEAFEGGDIYLFGSRVDDNKRGGDIDLNLVPNIKFDDERKRKINFLVKLDEYIGEQTIDVVMAKDKNRLIVQEALKHGESDIRYIFRNRNNWFQKIGRRKIRLKKNFLVMKMKELLKKGTSKNSCLTNLKP